MKYDFETHQEMERLISRQPGTIGDAIYRNEAERAHGYKYHRLHRDAAEG